MQKWKRAVLCGLSLLFLFISNSPSKAAFSTSDLEGAWSGHLLETGSSNGWEVTTLSINSSGAFTFSDTDSDGQSDTGSGLINISSDGFITMPGNESAHGIITLDQNLMILTYTLNTNNYFMDTFVKQGGNFSTADLEGNWSGHLLSTGNWKGWEVSTLSINSSGAFTVSDTDSDGQSDTDSGLINISSDGFITIPGIESSHGIMTLDKNLMILTYTLDSNNYVMDVFVKQGGNFTTADLEGTWSGHCLATGSSNGWEVTTLSINSSGAFTFSDTDSDGQSDTGSGLINISSDGFITMPGNESAHGIITLDKNLMVLTYTYGAGEYTLEFFTKTEQKASSVSVGTLPAIHLLLPSD